MEMPVTTWLIDTALFKFLASSKAKSLHEWPEANDASVFLSSASIVEIAAAIAKTSRTQSQRGNALRTWLDGITSHFADRIHPVDPETAMRAGALMPSLQSGLPRHRFHDAILAATAQIHGHGLLTRRDAIFGPWTKVPIATL
jgi:predicted nucleic acid-binding protein